MPPPSFLSLPRTPVAASILQFASAQRARSLGKTFWRSRASNPPRIEQSLQSHCLYTRGHGVPAIHPLHDLPFLTDAHAAENQVHEPHGLGNRAGEDAVVAVEERGLV